jgi:(E)-4-hydroxy-3-methylbut-2-enyl-diphosphate synthase
MSKTKKIKIGNITVGGGTPIPIQSMTNTYTQDAPATAAQIKKLAEAGCEIVRCAVPTHDAAKSLSEIKQILAEENIIIPIVADIHFDHRLAIAAMEHGADKVRINPGNIGDEGKVREVISAAKQWKIPIRIGVNSGSLEKNLIEKYGVCARSLAQSALNQIEFFEKEGIYDILISVKSSDVRENIEAARIVAAHTDVPQHIGITEAGSGERAVIKSAVGIGSLLLEGIGDTIRVSLTGDPVAEVRAARSLLASLGLLPGAVNVISCPTCGRCKVDLASVAAEVAEAAAAIELERKSGKTITAAVMGCAVNGPGEAKHADMGIACGDGNAVIFEHGEITGTVGIGDAAGILCEKIRKAGLQP